MKRLIASLVVLGVLFAPAVALANIESVNEATDEAGNVWKVWVGGALAGAEVFEHTSSGVLEAHWPTSIFVKGIAVDSGIVYVTEIFGVKEYTPSGAFIRRFDEAGHTPNGIATNPVNHQVFVGESHHVSWFTPGGELVGGFGSEAIICPARPGATECGWEMGITEGMAVSATGIVSVVDGPPGARSVGEYKNVWERIK